MHRDGAGIQHAEAKKTSQVTNMSTAIVRKDLSFVDILKSLLNYAAAIELQYGMNFVDARIRDILTKQCRLSIYRDEHSCHLYPLRSLRETAQEE